MSELLLDRVADDVVAALDTGRPPAGAHSRLYEDLGFDSLMLIELVDRLQERRPALGELPLPDLVAAMADIGSLTDLLRAGAAAPEPGDGGPADGGQADDGLVHGGPAARGARAEGNAA